MPPQAHSVGGVVVSAPAPFEHGDLVQLRSGGFQMTFNRITDDGSAHVYWSAGGEVRQCLIPPSLLVLAPTKPEAN